MPSRSEKSDYEPADEISRAEETPESEYQRNGSAKRSGLSNGEGVEDDDDESEERYDDDFDD